MVAAIIVAEAKQNTAISERRVRRLRCAVANAISASIAQDISVARFSEVLASSNDLYVKLDIHRPDSCSDGVQTAETGIH
jgi:hypothetical protein